MGDHRLNFFLFFTLDEWSQDASLGVPQFVVLIFVLHFSEINVQLVLFGLLVAEVQVNTSVVAFLKLRLHLQLVIVEVAIKVWQLFVVQFVLLHAVLENHSFSAVKE